MRNLSRIITAFLLLSLLLTACNLYMNSTPQEDASGAQTAVAQTVAVEMTVAALATTPAPLPEVATSTFTPTNPPPAPAGTCDQAQFVSETVPDNTVFLANASFTKTWRMRNVGTCTWTTAYALVFDHGNQMNAPAAVPLAGPVAPGQEVDLPVNLQAPAAPGTYTGYWRLRNASGVLFYTNSTTTFTVQIVVNPPTPTFTPTGGLVFDPGLIIPIIPLLLVPSTQQVYGQVTASAGGVGHATIACSSGSIVTGGGYAGNTNLFVYNSSGDGNGWEVYAQNSSGSGQLLNAYAICLSNTSGSTQQVYGQVTASAGGVGHAIVACPSGSIVTGGGYAGNTNLFVYNSSGDGNGWEVYAKNSSGSGQLLNAYAICLSGTSGTSQQVYGQVTASAGGVGHATIACPSGSIVTGGGYAGNTNLFVYNSSGDGNGWEVYAQNSSGSGQLLNAYAICTTFP